jgi:hypothetical protein
MIVFELDGIKPYPEPKGMGYGITLVGEYMSKEEYGELEGDLN